MPLLRLKKQLKKIQGITEKTGWRRAGALPLTFSRLGCECTWASTRLTISLYPYLSLWTHTHTNRPPLPPSGSSVLGDKHTHTHSRRGVGPAPLFLCALVTKEFWLPFPLFFIISHSPVLSLLSLYTFILLCSNIEVFISVYSHCVAFSVCASILISFFAQLFFHTFHGCAASQWGTHLQKNIYACN